MYVPHKGHKIKIGLCFFKAGKFLLDKFAGACTTCFHNYQVSIGLRSSTSSKRAQDRLTGITYDYKCPPNKRDGSCFYKMKAVGKHA